MTTIDVHATSLHEVLKSISRQLGNDQFQFICDETTIQIPDRYGSGYMKGINFQYGLGLLQLSLELKEAIRIRYQRKDSHPLRLVFCQQGYFSYEFEPAFEKYTIEALNISLSTSTAHYDQLYSFPANTPVTITILEINRREFLPKVECDLYTIPEHLAHVFRDVNAQDPFTYRTAYSLALSDCVYQIHENSLDGLSRKAFLEAKTLEMFALIIQLYKDDHLPGRKGVLLRKADIAKIREAERILVADLKFTPTIPELARKAGINTTKLKQGFKTVYGTTINKYLREKKLLFAAALLLNDTLSIRHIADLTGYSNPAHFSQLFRERFGALPSEYARNMKRKIAEDTSS